MKKSTTRFFLLVLMLIPLLSVAATGFFADIDASPYGYAIEGLCEMGVFVPEEGIKFFPAQPLTREEAAKWIVRAFALPEITPLDVDTDKEKKLTYSSGLGVIDESFTIPSFGDTAGTQNEAYVEALVNTRILEFGGNFDARAAISGAEFSSWLADAVFGVENETEAAILLETLDAYPEELLALETAISREQAAALLYSVVGDPRFKTITILVTADIHGHIMPYLPGGASQEIGGMAKMVDFVKEMRAAQPNLMLLDIGDAPYNTNVANLFEGEPVMVLMNMMGYDAMVLGNHDFDYPFTVMERNAGMANFPFLSANTFHNGEYPGFLHPYIVKEIDGITFAVIGVTDDESAWYTHPRNVVGITFEDHFDAARRVMEMEEVKNADVVMALAHLHGDNYNLSKQVEGFDFVFGGGNDVVAFPMAINDSYLVSAGKHAEMVGDLTLNFFEDELIGFTFANVFLHRDFPQDPSAKVVVDKYLSDMDEKLFEVVAQTEVDLDGERSTVRLKESNLANIIADSLRYLTGADFAIQNGGGVRASIPAGDISIKDIFTVLPFDNIVVVVEATGQTIWDALEHGVSWYPGAAGGFLQVSGLTYTFDAAKEPGSRIVEVLVDGKPIDLEKTYTLAANDFLTGGGDLYLMLAECKEVVRTKNYLREAFLQYLEEVGTIAPELEGRITILNEAQQ